MDKQKDFEKGWEEYKAKCKKEVEELGQDIADICSDMALNCCGNTPCYACIAKRLERKGYRKINKNAVVLTRGEYEELQVGKDFNYGYHSGETNMTAYYENIRLPEVRKETAEKFAERVKEETDHGISALYDSTVDEICKEIACGNHYIECHECKHKFDCERTYLHGCTDGEKWD